MISNWFQSILTMLDNSQYGRKRVAALLLILICGFAGAAYFGGSGIWFVIFSAFIAASAFDLLLIIFETSSDSEQYRKFRRFFFGPNKSGQIHLVFADFELNKTLLENKEHGNMIREESPPDLFLVPTNNDDEHFMVSSKETLPFVRSQHLRNKKNITLPSIDVLQVSALHDLQSLGYVASLVGKMSKNVPNIVTDTEAEQRNFIETEHLVSFGLFNNYCTHLAQLTGAKDLFSLKYDREDYKGILILHHIDDKAWACPGTQCAIESGEYTDNREYDWGLIAHIYPEGKPRSWFLVAGVGPMGTYRAGKYFAENWKDIYNKKTATGKAIEHREFALILKVPMNTNLPLQVERCIVRPDSE